MVQVHIARRDVAFCEFGDDVYPAACCKMAELSAREATRAAVRSVDGRLGTLRSTQVRGVSGSVVDAFSTFEVSLESYEPCVVHLLQLLSAADVGTRILFHSIVIRLFPDLPRRTTSPAVTLLQPGCPVMLLVLLLSGCPLLASWLLLLPGYAVPNISSHRFTCIGHVVSGNGKHSVTSGPTAASRDQTMRRAQPYFS